jgi:hypothetical protein
VDEKLRSDDWSPRFRFLLTSIREAGVHVRTWWSHLAVYRSSLMTCARRRGCLGGRASNATQEKAAASDKWDSFKGMQDQTARTSARSIATKRATMDVSLVARFDGLRIDCQSSVIYAGRDSSVLVQAKTCVHGIRCQQHEHSQACL